jgi:hypothetical protein
MKITGNVINLILVVLDSTRCELVTAVFRAQLQSPFFRTMAEVGYQASGIGLCDFQATETGTT